MTLEIFIKIAQFQVTLAALFVLISIVFIKRISGETKLLAWALLPGLMAFFSLGLLDLKGKEVNVPQTLDAIIYFCVLTVLYNYTLGGKYKKWFLTIGIFFLIVAGVNLLLVQQMDNNTYTKVLRSIFVTSYCVVYCYRLMADLPVQHLHRVPMFWYNSGILIFNAGTLFLFLFTNYLVEVLHDDLLIYWTFHNILNIVQVLVILFGLWVDLRNIKLRSSSPSVP